jgi:hypothetical protein
MCLLIACVAFAVPAAGQIPTGTISGHIVDSSGGAVPGVTVTATSSALQGTRTAVTSQHGDYVLPLLPAGKYNLTFHLSGFGDVKQTRDLQPTQLLQLDVTMKPAAVTEEIAVVAELPQFSNTIQSATTMKSDLLSVLPTARTITSALLFAPQAHQTGPSNAFSIGGAMSFESSFFINGVQIQDNLRGTPFNLFIEDAIDNTTILTSGISAEYGRFTGGVINAVTKSGGNQFTGSLRETLTNDNWRTVSPFNEPKTDKTIPTTEYTIGGRILPDRTWFFSAGRFVNTSSAYQTAATGIPYVASNRENRFEGKVTQKLNDRHSVEVAYTGIQREDKNYAFPDQTSIMDTRSLINRQLPQTLFATHYKGILGSNLFVEAQLSLRKFTFKGSGGTQTDLINGTLLMDQQTGNLWWSPAFCGVCTNEQRDNSDFLVKGNYFWSTPRGAHNIVFGYDGFNDRRKSDNHQSASDWHIWTTGSRTVGNQVFPVILPGASTWIIHWPIAEASRGTNFRTNALFVNDSWQYNRQLTFNLGLRFDGNHGADAAGNLVTTGKHISPRLGASYDLKNDGKWILNASYSQYVAAISNSIADSAAPAGQPSTFAWFYGGSAINPNPTTDTTSPQAIQQVFNWFNSPSTANPSILNSDVSRAFFVSIPGVTPVVDPNLKSPFAHEFAAGVTHQLTPKATVRANVVFRTFRNFYTDKIDTTTGQVDDTAGNTFDLDIITNTNAVERNYKALDVQGTFRPIQRVALGGSYTLSQLRGNVNGENINSGPITSGVLAYPEYSEPSWNNPVGDLLADQRHRARIWGSIDLLDRPMFGHITAGLVQVIESGTPYGAIGAVDSTPFVNNGPLGYITPAGGTVNYYFTARDAFRTSGQKRTDLSINYTRRLPGARRGELFAQAQLLNIFNQFNAYNLSTNKLNTTVLTNVDDPTLTAFNPFTTTPVQGTHWRFDENTDGSSKFGNPTAADAYTLPRTFLMQVGVRF